MTVDLRPCPGCRLLTSDYGEARYLFPGALTEGGKYAAATREDVAVGGWRCSACIGKDTRTWRELGRPAPRKPAASSVLLRLGDGP